MQVLVVPFAKEPFRAPSFEPQPRLVTWVCLVKGWRVKMDLGFPFGFPSIPQTIGTLKKRHPPLVGKTISVAKEVST